MGCLIWEWGPDVGGLIWYGACNGGPGVVRNVPNPALVDCSFNENTLRWPVRAMKLLLHTQVKDQRGASQLQTSEWQ